MAETQDKDEAAAPKSGRTGLLVGVLALALGAGGGFYATFSGLLLGPKPAAAEAGAEGDSHGAGHGSSTAGSGGGALHGEPVVAGGSNVVFIPVNPLVISLAGSDSPAHLRFTSQLEVPQEHGEEVARLMPRVVDVMNGYLRAVDPADLETPGALIRLRAQMLRRVELVVGPGRVSDVLVMEFVLS